MTDPVTKTTAAKAVRRSSAGDVFFVVSSALVAMGLGAGLHFIAQASLQAAALAGLSVFSLLVAAHALIRRQGTVAALDAEIAELRAEILTLRSGRPSLGAAIDRARAAVATGRPAQGTGSPASLPPQAPTVGDAAAQFGRRLRSPAESAPDWSIRPGTHREPRITGGLAMAGHPEPSGPLPMMPPAAAPAKALAEPPHISLAPLTPPVAEAPPTPAVANVVPRDVAADAITIPILAPTPLNGPAVPESDTAPRAMARPDTAAWPQAVPKVPTATLDLDTMQNLIGQLADQLNQPHEHEAEPAVAASAAEARSAATVAREIAQRPTLAPPAEFKIESPADFLANGPAPAATAAGNPDAAPFGHLALIAEAVEAKRMDVLLDPILGLSDRRARHFELSVRLLTEAGDGFDESELQRLAEGTGLLARLDAAKLASAADVLNRLRTRGSRASLFSAIAGESLADQSFAGTFADILAAEEGNTARLVLTFAQAEARTFTPAHWRTITAMSEIGLKFAVTDVTDLDMDFEVLKRHGFDFIKLDAPVFLEGLPAPGGHIPAADICRHLAGLGLGLIVGGIVAEKDLARILGFGAILGQGTLFGGPRSVELERERRAA